MTSGTLNAGGFLVEVPPGPDYTGPTQYAIGDASMPPGTGRALTTTDTHTHTGMLDQPMFTGSSEDGTATGLGSTPISILQPYFVVRFIMKT